VCLYTVCSLTAHCWCSARCPLLACRRAEEAAAAAEIARIEEAALEVGHKFSSLAEEAAEKTKKLKKLWKKYQV
jgi:hypothetical protein